MHYKHGHLARTEGKAQLLIKVKSYFHLSHAELKLNQYHSAKATN